MIKTFLFIGFALVIIKAYVHLQYDKERRSRSSVFIRWIIGIYPLSIWFPIVSVPRSEKEHKLKTIGNVAVYLSYLIFALTLVIMHFTYRK